LLWESEVRPGRKTAGFLPKGGGAAVIWTKKMGLSTGFLWQSPEVMVTMDIGLTKAACPVSLKQHKKQRKNKKILSQEPETVQRPLGISEYDHGKNRHSETHSL
jgi:hypothetical protein